MEIPFTIDWNALATGAAGGLIVFVVTLISEYFVRKLERKQEQRDQNVVTFHNENRRITGSVFSYLRPGATIEMMRTDLGAPNRQFETEAGIYSKEVMDYAFDEEPDYSQKFTAYLYIFKNAAVKIISKDGVAVDALTVLSNSADIHLPHSPKQFFNSYMVECSFFEGFDATDVKFESFPGCRDTFNACTVSTHRPGTSEHITYFIYHDDIDLHGVELGSDMEGIQSSKIEGVCISSSLDNISYIYSSEL